MVGNVIGERLDSIKTAWKATCRRAGVEDLHFHDFRREAACRWFEAGVPLHHIRDLLGHDDISTTSRLLGGAPDGAPAVDADGRGAAARADARAAVARQEDAPMGIGTRQRRYGKFSAM